MKILIDVLGADKGIEEIVIGALAALESYDFLPIFVGPEEEIRKYIPESKAELIEIIDADEMISNEEKPALAIRRKKNSSMVKAFRALKDNQGDGMISTGSTGALLAGATLIIGRIENVERAAITLNFPGLQGSTVMLDVGANMDITPDLMLQFAKMGSSYAKVLLGKEKPKIAMLNIGSEEGKGNQLSLASYEVLKNSDLNFIGNVEPYDLLNTEADVLVTDGFAGNIALKSVEGTGKTLLKLVKDITDESFMAKIGAGLILPPIKKTLEKLELDKIGAAPLLGSKKPVFKAHGSSNHKQIEVGILQLINFINEDVIKDIEESMEVKNG